MWIRRYGSSAHIGHDGTVQSWKVGDVEIFFPEQFMDQNERPTVLRGGMPVCAPVWGNVPEDDFARRFIFGDISQKDACGLGMTGLFEDCRVTITIELPNVGALMHQLEVTNLSSDNQLPVRPGLHPYFATPAFSMVIVGGEERTVEKNELLVDADLRVIRVKNGLVEFFRLGKGYGRVSMDLVGYDHVVMWRDRLDYLCVEPVLGEPDKLRLLNPAEKLALSVKFTFMD